MIKKISHNNIRNILDIMEYSLDINEAIVRLIKYLLEGLSVGLVTYFITNPQPSAQEIMIIALTAAAVFSILDILAPAISSGARQGTGLGVGFKLMGFP